MKMPPCLFDIFKNGIIGLGNEQTSTTEKRNLVSKGEKSFSPNRIWVHFWRGSRPNKSWLKGKKLSSFFVFKASKMPPSTNPQPTLKLKLGHFLLHFLNFSGCFFRWANQATPFRSTSADVVVGRSLQSVLHAVYPTLGRNGCQFVKDVSHSGSTYLGTSTQQPNMNMVAWNRGCPRLCSQMYIHALKKKPWNLKIPPQKEKEKHRIQTTNFWVAVRFFQGCMYGEDCFSLNFNVAF